MKRYGLAFLILLFALSPVFAQDSEKRFSVPLEDSPLQGPADAAVTMIEFIDYQ